MTEEQARLYTALAERHGHYCPMSTLGVRLGEAVMNRLDLGSADHWRFRYDIRTCAVDGLRIVLEQQRPEVVIETTAVGRHRLYCQGNTGKDLSVELSEDALRLAGEYRELDETQKVRHLEMMRALPVERLVKIVEGPED